MLVVLNNKSNLNKEEYKNYLKELSNIKTNHYMILCPSTINISMSDNLEKISLGAQNVSSYKNGAHTGEVSAEQLSSYNVKYSLVGHSERRLEQKEKEEDFKSKIDNLLKEGITPIYCVGETLEEKNNNMTKKVIKKELEIINPLTEDIIIAYEPIWAIGTGFIPEQEEVEEVITLIKNILPNTKALYGGSVNEENIKMFNKIKSIDGYLIGGVSLYPDKIERLLLNIEN